MSEVLLTSHTEELCVSNKKPTSPSKAKEKHACSFFWLSGLAIISRGIAGSRSGNFFYNFCPEKRKRKKEEKEKEKKKNPHHERLKQEG